MMLCTTLRKLLRVINVSNMSGVSQGTQNIPARSFFSLTLSLSTLDKTIKDRVI